MLLALIGLDEFGKDERIAEFWKEALADGSQRRVFFASEYAEGSLVADVAQAMTPSFFGPGASVLIRHCEFMPAEEQRKLTGFLEGAQGNLALDFLADVDKIDKRGVLWKYLEKQKATELFAPPKYTEGIQKWIMTHVQKYFNRKIEPAAALYIADSIGGDTKCIHNEIKKIFLYDNRIPEIKMQHCSLFVKQDRDIPSYELQGPFGYRNLEVFLPKFRRILAEKGNKAFMPIIFELRNHCLTLLHIQSMRSKNIPDYEIKSKILPPNRLFTYEKNKLPDQSSRWRLGNLQKTILRLDEISYGITMGSYSSLPSFELAICGLML
ncbi:MAG: hypothetical protein FWB90_05710 [Fibromonadales bacterium]|nr:hypothetical protein [Fibromonadales bacterium]